MMLFLESSDWGVRLADSLIFSVMILVNQVLLIINSTESLVNSFRLIRIPLLYLIIQTESFALTSLQNDINRST